MRHIFTISALTALLSLFSVTASAYDIAVENEGVTIYYNFINDGTELEVTFKDDNYNSYSGVVVIPEEVTYNGKTYNVTSIGREAFYHCFSLTSITIPNSVTTIGRSAFSRCSDLTSVTIPNSVTIIGTEAFYGCFSLTSVTLSNGLTVIGGSAFMLCRSLTSVSIPNGVTSIENGTFCDCNGLTSVTLPNSVTTIGDRAFFRCSGLTSVTIPNSVTSIRSSAFSYCFALTSVTIPASIETIGEYAFSNDKALTDVICLRPRPIMINANVFENVLVHGSCDLHVPVGSKVRYEVMDGWKEFAFIIEDADTWAPSSRYDLNGDGKISTADIQVIINEMKK